MRRAVARICAGWLLLAALGGCGYHTSGHADLLPKRIKTIAVPAFDNATTRYRLTGRGPRGDVVLGLLSPDEVRERLR